jgi:hypothetical protein
VQQGSLKVRDESSNMKKMKLGKKYGKIRRIREQEFSLSYFTRNFPAGIPVLT